MSLSESALSKLGAAVKKNCDQRYQLIIVNRFKTVNSPYLTLEKPIIAINPPAALQDLSYVLFRSRGRHVGPYFLSLALYDRRPGKTESKGLVTSA